MRELGVKLSPQLQDSLDEHRRHIAEWWSRLWIEEDWGETTREVLESLESQVMECLYAADPPDIVQAASLTAKAAFLIIGCSNL